MKKRFLFSIGLLSLGVGACNKCDDTSPMSTELHFFIVSPTWQNRIGTGTGQYAPDSLTISYQGMACEFEVYPESMAGPSAGPLISLSTLRYVDGKSDARFLLQLSSTDTDTLDFTYSLREDKCATAIDYHSVFLNGRRMGVDGYDYYQLVKR
jgi:hypothetical protein